MDIKRDNDEFATDESMKDRLPRKEKKAYRSFVDGVENGYTPRWTKRIVRIYTSFVQHHIEASR